MKLTYDCSPNLLRFFVKEAKYNQEKIASILNVTPAAVSKAIDSEPGLDTLRKRIVDLIKTKKQAA